MNSPHKWVTGCLLLGLLAASQLHAHGRSDSWRPSAGLGDGFHTVLVPQLDGTVDEIEIYAASPPEGDDLPVVIVAEGQGSEATNCRPDGLPPTRVAELLAGQGYLGIGFTYRNTGRTAPPIGTVKLRDHAVLDARAVLAIAQWAASEHGRGSNRVALIGYSMGTWVVAWAASSRFEVEDLQAGLEIRSTLLVGESASHLSNWAGRRFLNFSFDVCEFDPPRQWVVWPRLGMEVVVRQGGITTVTAADLEPGTPFGDALAVLATPDGIDQLRMTFFEPAPADIEECAEVAALGLPPNCEMACEVLTTFRFAEERSLNLLTDLDTRLATRAEPVICAAGPKALDPLEFFPDLKNPYVLSGRNDSPAYALEGYAAPQASSILAANDGLLVPAARDRLVGLLRDLAVDVTEHTPPGEECSHATYFSPPLDCGWKEIVLELARAFEP